MSSQKTDESACRMFPYSQPPIECTTDEASPIARAGPTGHLKASLAFNSDATTLVGVPQIHVLDIGRSQDAPGVASPEGDSAVDSSRDVAMSVRQKGTPIHFRLVSQTCLATVLFCICILIPLLQLTN